MIEAVIFDVDGTLVDSVDFHARAWQRALKEYGKEVDFQTVRGQIGKGGDQLMPEFLSKAEIEKFGDDVEEKRREIFQKEYLQRIEAFPKVRELFERIKRDGKQIVLASSSPEEELEHFKKLLNIADLIEGDTNADDAEESKPEPDIFLAAMKKIGNPKPEETIVIGDTPYDAEAAGKAKLETIGFLCGDFPEQQLRDAGCIEIYQDPADLLARYDESSLGKSGEKTKQAIAE